MVACTPGLGSIPSVHWPAPSKRPVPALLPHSIPQVLRVCEVGRVAISMWVQLTLCCIRCLFVGVCRSGADHCLRPYQHFSHKQHTVAPYWPPITWYPTLLDRPTMH